MRAASSLGKRSRIPKLGPAPRDGVAGYGLDCQKQRAAEWRLRVRLLGSGSRPVGVRTWRLFGRGRAHMIARKEPRLSPAAV